MKTFLKLLFTFFLFVFLLLLFFNWRVKEGLKPVNLGDKKVSFTVKRGERVDEIVRKLDEKSLINSPLIFKYYLKYKKVGRLIKAGEYEFSGIVTADTIIKTLQKGTTHNYKLTFPEGLNLHEVVKIFEKSKMKDRFEVPKYMHNMDPHDYGLNMDTIEGCLYPETYFYTKNTSSKKILEKMIASFKKNLPPDYEVSLKKQGLSSLNELLTMASIVEKEAKLDSERLTIASVFLNRLKKKMPLESCATVIYALGHWKERLLYEDLKVESPYNTYKNRTLPPTPICSPGKKSILAVLNAPKSNYYYFVTRGDGSGGHIFSKTFKEHKRAIMEFKRKLKRRKK